MKNTKVRTEAIVRNFLVKRADRLASSGLELSRLVDRLAEECDDEHTRAPRDAGARLAAPAALGATDRERLIEREAGFGPSPYAGRNDRAEPAGDRFRADPNTGALLADASEPLSGEPGTSTTLGSVAYGTATEGRMNLSGSLAEMRSQRRAADRARTNSGIPLNDCAERKRDAMFDMWFEGAFEFFNYAQSKGHFGLFKLGFDYKIAPGVLVGALVQFDSAQDRSASLGYLVKGNGWMAGPYAAVRLGQGIILDARVLAGASDNEVSPYLTYSDPFSSERWLAAARLSGHWSWNGVSVMPSVEYVHFADKSSSFIDSRGIAIASQRVDIDRIIFGPEFRYAIPILDGSGSSVAVHLSTRGLWDLNPLSLEAIDDAGPAERRSDFHARLDPGVAVQSPNGVSAGLAFGLEGLGGDDYTSKSVTGKLKIPLN